MGSPLAQFILWLYRRALADGRVPEVSDESLAVLQGMGNLPSTQEDSVEYKAGLEIFDGRPHSDLARKLQRRAVSELTDLTLALINVDESGYTAINVRALLAHHFWTLRGADLGSDAHCAYIDLITAINKASPRARTVAWLLIAGLGPQEVSVALGSVEGDGKKTNGSRRINRTMAELTKIMSGRGHYGEATSSSKP